MPRVLVAGLGNKYMGDDGFGPRVVETLMSGGLPHDVEVRDVGLCGVTLAPDLDDYGLVIFVDAVKKGGKFGTIYRAEIEAEQLTETEPREGMDFFTFSTHRARLEELILFAKAIGTLPANIVVIGCEVVEIALGEGLSREVEDAIPRATELVLMELQRYCERK